VLKQLTPVTPVIDHEPVPVGVTPVVGPETVAVKVKVEPTVVVAALVTTATSGVNLAIVMLNGCTPEDAAER
jgi:hypothetical protein